MTTIRIPEIRGEQAAPVSHRISRVQTALLVSGALSSLWYLAMDLLSAMRYPGYSLLHQAISELSAIGAPTSQFWASLSPMYGLLVLAFAVGVLREARGSRALRLTGWLLLALSATGILWWMFPMHQRGADFAPTDLGHILMGAGSVIFIPTFIAAGARTLGRNFRTYSLATLPVFLLGGIGSFLYVNRMIAQEPTPWLGVVERTGIYSYLLWIGVFSIALLRERHRSKPRLHV